jgi:energy-coupling factor transporter ATP-binding protein EcfA2
VGEAGAGKSNLLAAVRALLDPISAPITARDVAQDGEPVRITGRLADGSTLTLDGDPVERRGPDRPPVLFLPASLRDGRLVPRSRRRSRVGGRAMQILREKLPGEGASTAATESARGLVAGLETWTAEGLSGLVVLIEEPELYLPPQSQRYLYRLLHRLADQGNQVLYSTHSPAFLNVARLDELVIAERHEDAGTRLLQPEPLPEDEEFRAASEFDASRGEVFLARAAVLVEGLTEKLTLPFVFAAFGFDPDRERISIVECGGKSNIVLIARVCAAVGIPFVAVHDRDAAPGKQPSLSERQLNALIAEAAGDRRVELAPDFEGVAGLRGHHHKPARAFKSFSAAGGRDVPEPLARVVRLAIELAGAEPS